MSDFANKPTELGGGSQDFSRLLDESGFRDDKENIVGKVVDGTVVRVEQENVFVNIGLRSEGIVPLKEFLDETGAYEVSEGQKVEVLVKSAGRGLPRISKSEADAIKNIKRLKEIFESGETVRVTAAKRIKGGVECVTEGSEIKAFMPSSEVQMRNARQNADKIIGSSFDALIIELDGRRVVLSRKRVLEKLKAERVAGFIKSVDVGMEIKGVVSNTIDSGAFVDLTDGSGIVEGFIPISEVAWRRVKTPADVLKPGQEIKVKIINLDSESGRIGLSYKQTQPTPWQEFAEKTPQNSRLKGKIKNVNKAGVFVEVARDVVGLLHPDNISWKEAPDPLEVYGSKKGEQIEVVMLKCDPAREKMSLGVKQLQKDPWKTAVKKLKRGETVVTGRVKKESRGGLILELGDDIEGFIRFSDIADSDGSEHYKAGMEIKGVVKNVDNEARSVSLSSVMLHKKNEREILKEFNSTHGEGDAPKLGDLMSGQMGSDENDK
ncbi:MAG: S1 RNA-binding domain-containing protein [Thermodesulfobacteriota bacterium]